MKSLLVLFAVFGLSILAAGNDWSLVDLENLPVSDSGVVIADDYFGKESPWSSFARVHGPHPDREKILALCKFTQQGNTRRITILPGVNAFKSRSGGVQMVTAGVSRYFQIPADSAGKSFKVEMTSVLKGKSEAFLFFYQKNKLLKQYRGVSGIVPAGADRAYLIYRLYGAGEMALTKAKATLEEQAFKEDIIAYALSYMDKRFYLPEKGAIPIFFMGKRPEKKFCKDVILKLTLPAGVKVFPAEKTTVKVSENTFDVSKEWAAHFPGGYCCWRPLQLMISAERPLNGEEMGYQLIYRGSPRPVKKLKLYTMPAVAASAPELFNTGIMMQWGGNMTAAAAESYKKLYTRSGFNAARFTCSPELLAAFKSAKTALAGNNWGIRDGYPRANKNNTQPFIGIDGQVFRNQICPQAVYTHKIPSVKKAFEEVHAHSRFFMNNWEAYSSDYKGCFCNFCKEEFIRYSKLPRKSVEEVWPKQVIAKFHDSWVKFRSWQHGLICKTLAEYSAASGGEFVPMISVVSFNRNGSFCPQYHPDDYLKYLRWINVWGPYLHTAGLNRPYKYTPGHYLKHYYGVKNVVEFIRSRGGKNVNITGLPYGSHGVSLNLPEAIALETVNNFILGYKGSLIYWFHFDYRYWALMARANAKIAACEKMVAQWRKEEKFSLKPVTPYLAPRHWRAYITAYNTFPELEKAESALIGHLWKNEKRYLAAVGNFWERSGVFFKLAIPGLQGEYVVRTPYEPYRYVKVAGSELARGVLLEAGPLTWEFFLVEPFEKGKAYGTPFNTAHRLNAEKERIRKRFEEEEHFLAEFEKMFKAADFSFDETPEFTAGSVTLAEKRENGVQNLAVTTPLYKAVVAPANGGNIKSLLINGKEAVLQEKHGNFGKPGFWRPKGILIEEPLKIESIKALKNYVEVVLSRPATANFNLRVVWKFYSDRIAEEFTVQNAGKFKVTTVTRFHHRPMHLANHSDSFFTIGEEKFSVIQKDRFLIQKQGALGKEVNIKGGDTLFTAPRMKSSLLHRGLDPIQGYYIWNSPGAATGSFEPVFEGRELAPGETLTIRQEWEIRK